MTNSDSWSDLLSRIEVFARRITKLKAVNVNSKELREDARRAVQSYFRYVRPELEILSMPSEATVPLDELFQDLLRLANGRNARRTYQKLLRDFNQLRPIIEAERDIAIGQQIDPSSAGLHQWSRVEQQILATLQRMIPSAALSYEQGLNDLSESNRVSFRGTAAEFRECLREVLDHLAPDMEVMKVEGFELERDRTKPTMRQKAEFILRSRGITKTARSPAGLSVRRIEESAGMLARSVYRRSSLSTHVATSKSEVEQMKMYVDGVLAELLKIHHTDR